MTTPSAISCRDLQKAFAGRRVLHGIDLDVGVGEFLGLVGPNGAGKSTLLRLWIGLIRRTGGDVAVLGFDPERATLAVRHRCSYLPGETSVYQQMTGSAFLQFALSFQRHRNADRQRQLAELFALPLQQKVRGYSAGMKQKLAILAALAADVDLYLLDEPDRALDATMRAELRQVLRALHRSGRTIVLSSHHLEELQDLATRLEFLRNGTLIPTDEVVRARVQLAGRCRLRLADGVALPKEAAVLDRQPDGVLLLSHPAPLQWLGSLPAGAVRAAEVGTIRLEDLYGELFLARPIPAAPAGRGTP